MWQLIKCSVCRIWSYSAVLYFPHCCMYLLNILPLRKVWMSTSIISKLENITKPMSYTEVFTHTELWVHPQDWSRLKLVCCLLATQARWAFWVEMKWKTRNEVITINIYISGYLCRFPRNTKLLSQLFSLKLSPSGRYVCTTRFLGSFSLWDNLTVVHIWT